MPTNPTAEACAYPRPPPNPEWLGDPRTDLPIVDPHHHLWEHPGSRDLLNELLADVGSGDNIVATVFIQCGSGYRTSGPEEMRPIGESEFVRAITEEADRRGSKTRICSGIVSQIKFSCHREERSDEAIAMDLARRGGIASPRNRPPGPAVRGVAMTTAYDVNSLAFGKENDET